MTLGGDFAGVIVGGIAWCVECCVSGGIEGIVAWCKNMTLQGGFAGVLLGCCRGVAGVLQGVFLVMLQWVLQGVCPWFCRVCCWGC